VQVAVADTGRHYLEEHLGATGLRIDALGKLKWLAAAAKLKATHDNYPLGSRTLLSLTATGGPLLMV